MRKIFVLTTVLALCLPQAKAQKIYSLEQIVDSAKVNNIALGNSRLEVEAARQQRLEAFASFFPSISANALHFNANKGLLQTDLTIGDHIPSDIGMMLAGVLPAESLASLSNPISIEMMKNGTVAAVTALQPVFAGGQIVNGNRLARVGEDVSRLRLLLAENSTEETAGKYFWQLASLLEKEKTVAAVEELLKEFEKDVKAAVDAGVAMQNDLLQVQLRENETASQKLKVANGIRLVKMLLAQFCGLPDEDFSISYDSSENVRPASPAGEPEALVAGTIEYKLLGKKVEAARLNHHIEVGRHLPTLAVGAGYTYNDLLDKGRHSGMLFATLSVPITDWWGGSHAIKRRKIALRQAEDELKDNSALLRIRIQNAWNNVEEAYEQLQLSVRSMEQAEENLRLSREYYKAGTTRMTDLLEAQMLYQKAMDGRTDAFAEYRVKLLEYRHETNQNL